MTDDAALLRRYIDERAEEPFTELVRRHLAMVYAIGLRRSDGNPAAAAGVAERVFGRLAREAETVSRHGLLVSWLHLAVMGEAIDAPPRGEGGLDATHGDPGTVDWAGALEGALELLPEDDRAALLLLHWECRSLADVGAELNLGPDAARLCTQRAADKLRAVLANRGIRVGPGALATVLERQALVPTPAERADRIARGALAVAAADAVTLEQPRPFLAALAGLINSGTALATAAVIVIAGALSWSHRANARLEAELVRLRGEGQVLAGLQRENRRMARLAAEAEELRREVADLPALRASVYPQGLQAGGGTTTLTVTTGGGLRWENDDITPDGMLERLREFQGRFPGDDTSIVVRGTDAPLPVVTYVLDEIRKAGIKRIVVDGDPQPNPGFGGWF